jgi:hypothetical protein
LIEREKGKKGRERERETGREKVEKECKSEGELMVYLRGKKAAIQGGPAGGETR